MSLRFRALLGVLLIVLPVSPLVGEETTSDPQRFPFAGLVTGDRVNLRAGPGLSYAVLSSLARRAKVTVTAHVGEWYGVSVPGGRFGWVHEAYVTFLEPAGSVAEEESPRDPSR